jgi:Ion channel
MRRPNVGHLTQRAPAQRRELVLRQRYGLLLICLFALFIVMGVASGGPWQNALITALAAATLILALRAGEVRPRLTAAFTVISVGLVVLVAVLAAAGVSNAATSRVTAFALVAIAPPAIVVGVVRGLRERGGATVQAVMGVLCIYLLLGMICAFLYGSIDRLGGDPFFAGGLPATVSNCLYFSFTTLTTVGYGDLTARSSLGHTLAVSEALIGQIYLVTVVAVLVSGFTRTVRAGDRPAGATSSASDDGAPAGHQ